MSTPLRILHLEDNRFDAELIHAKLGADGITIEVSRVASRSDFVAALEQGLFDLILSDYALPNFDGMTALQLAVESRADKPFIFVSGALGEDVAIECLKLGASDYVLKDRLERLGPSVRRAIREIEERQKQKLAQKEIQRLNKVLEHRARSIAEMLEGIQILDPEWRYVYANAAAARLGHYSAAELVGRTMMECHPGIADTPLFAAMSAVMETRTPRHVQSEFALADGTKGWFEMSVEPDPNGILIRSMDITERRQAEEALRNSEVSYRRLFEASKDGLIILDALTGEIKDVNPFLIEMLGYSHVEFLGKHLWEIGAFKDIVANKTKFVELQQNRYVRYENLPLETKGGGCRFVEFISNVYDVNGRQIFQCNLRDNTDRKLAEEQAANFLRELKDVKAAIDEHALVAITDAKGKITYVNDKFCAISKYAREELMGQDHRIINSGFHSKEFIRDIWQTIGAGRVWKGEIRNKTKDGTFYWVDTTIVPYLGENGRPVQFIAIRADITERKHFEEALQESNVKLESAKAAAERANLAKSDFLSKMSHELRSPLNAILGFAQLMESAIPEPTVSQSKSIAQILQAGWYLLELINEVLDLAVIESGKVSLSPEPVSLPEILSECQGMMEPQAQARGIRMTFPQFENPLFVSADRTRLKQVVINLVSNAIKYNREQGNVIVECTVSAPERIRISVKDTGEGLSPEKMEQLFCPFNRLGQESGSVTGTGIGLVVSKRLVEVMGGVIGVESTAGAGSVFWCELNSAEAPPVVARSGDTEALRRLEVAGDAPRRTLLYVEDNPANLKLVEELIARFPALGLVTAKNGTLGIESARATCPQVILMDVNLPGLSGTQAMKILRKDPVTAHIPVIALSANAMPRDIEKGLEAGFFRYLTKPIIIKELMKTLNEGLELAGKSSVNTRNE